VFTRSIVYEVTLGSGYVFDVKLDLGDPVAASTSNLSVSSCPLDRQTDYLVPARVTLTNKSVGFPLTTNIVLESDEQTTYSTPVIQAEAALAGGATCYDLDESDPLSFQDSNEPAGASVSTNIVFVRHGYFSPANPSTLPTSGEPGVTLTWPLGTVDESDVKFISTPPGFVKNPYPGTLWSIPFLGS
jgi:hypothetical protein